MASLSVQNGFKFVFFGFIYSTVKLFELHVFVFLNILRFVNQLINFINNLKISSQNNKARSTIIITDCTATRIATSHRIDDSRN